MKAEFRMIPMAEIQLGQRRRTDYGDIPKLAAGIKRVGLLHPLILHGSSGHYTVVAGGRRFKALELMRVPAAPARLYETLTDEELRQIELEENDYTKLPGARERQRTLEAQLEAQRQIVADAKQAEEIIAHSRSTSERESKSKSGNKKKRGGQKKPASKAEIAAAIGVSETALINAEQRVAAIEEYPFLKGKHWSEHDVAEATPQNNRAGEMRFGRTLGTGNGNHFATSSRRLIDHST